MNRIVCLNKTARYEIMRLFKASSSGAVSELLPFHPPLPPFADAPTPEEPTEPGALGFHSRDAAPGATCDRTAPPLALGGTGGRRFLDSQRSSQPIFEATRARRTCGGGRECGAVWWKTWKGVECVGGR